MSAKHLSSVSLGNHLSKIKNSHGAHMLHLRTAHMLIEESSLSSKLYPC